MRETATMSNDPTIEEPQPTRESHLLSVWHRSAFVPLVPALVVCGLANFAVAPLMDEFRPQDWGALLVYSCFGWNLAQVGLLSVGMTLGHESFLRRLTICCALAMVLLVLWIAGASTTMHLGRLIELPLRREGRMLTVGMPVIFLASQIPLWIARIYFGWRFEQPLPTDPATAPASPSEGKLSLRDLFITTALISVVLGLGRLIATSPRVSSGADLWIPLALAALASTVISLITTLPLLRILSLPHSLPVCLVLATGYTLLAGGIAVSLLLTSIGMNVRAWYTVGVMTTIANFALCMLLGLSCLRGKNWRLERDGLC
jgi:hypothetical protein